VPESFSPAQGPWETLPERSASALRQALIASLDLENPNFDTPTALRATVKEAIAKNKLLEVRQILRDQISEDNKAELESLQELLSEEARLHHFEGNYEKQMSPEEEHAVITFLKEHKLAIAIVGVGLVGGLQAAGIVALFNIPQVIEQVQSYFSSASEAVQGWWSHMQGWIAGDTAVESQLAAQTEAGEVTQQIIQEHPVAYDEDPPPDTKSAESDSLSPSEVSAEGEDPFAASEAAETAGTM